MSKMNYWEIKKLQAEERDAASTWYKKGKTYRAQSLEALKVLYGAGIHATLESQPETHWKNDELPTPTAAAGIKPAGEPKGITTRKGGGHHAKRGLPKES